MNKKTNEKNSEEAKRHYTTAVTNDAQTQDATTSHNASMT